MPARTVLGIDASTQSFSAVLLDAENGSVLHSHSIAYREDPRLYGLGFVHETLIMPPREEGEAEQPPLLFAAALDALFADLCAAGVAMHTIAAINTSGQQHGHVYLNATARSAFAHLRQAESTTKHLAELISTSFAYGGAPIWKTANTQQEALHIMKAAGGQATVIAHTGSAMPLRFAAPVHRKLATRYPKAYAATQHIVQISSFIPALLAGDCTLPLDFANACGTGLMNYRARCWDPLILAATAAGLPNGEAGLSAKLPALCHPLSTVGYIAAYFQAKYGLAADCRIIAGSGDNPQSKVLASGNLLSLGTSFVYMLATPDECIDTSGSANAMYDGLGRPFNFACRTNGALVWDRLRSHYGLGAKDYAACDAALTAVGAGSGLRFWHPDSESFPLIAADPHIRRFDDAAIDFAHDFSAIVDSALGLMYLYGQDIGGAPINAEKAAISVCGGASNSTQIMRRIAALWNRPAIAAGQAGAALGAALAAAVACQAETSPEQRIQRAEALRHQHLAHCPEVLPDSTLVAAYHGAGGYLERLACAFNALKRI